MLLLAVKKIDITGKYTATVSFFFCCCCFIFKGSYYIALGDLELIAIHLQNTGIHYYAQIFFKSYLRGFTNVLLADLKSHLLSNAEITGTCRTQAIQLFFKYQAPAEKPGPGAIGPASNTSTEAMAGRPELKQQDCLPQQQHPNMLVQTNVKYRVKIK